MSSGQRFGGLFLLALAAAGTHLAAQEQGQEKSGRKPYVVVEVDVESVKGFIERARSAPGHDLSEEARGLHYEAVVKYLRADGKALDAEGRRIALGLLALHATSEDLGLMADLALDAKHEAVFDPSLGPAFQAALEDGLRRLEVTSRDLHWLSSVSGPVLLEVVRAAGACGQVEVLPWLGEQVNVPALAGAALQEMSRLAADAPRELADESAAWVRPVVDATSRTDQNLCKHAVRVLGLFEDVHSMEPLVALLEHDESGGLGKTVHAALKRIAGYELPARAKAWRNWYDAEVKWRNESAPRALAQLGAETDAEVVMAIRELSAHSLFRHELALPMAQRLGGHPSAPVRAELCRALGALKAREVQPYLLLALEDDDLGVRAAAHQALTALTGLQLPADVEAWAEALAG